MYRTDECEIREPGAFLPLTEPAQVDPVSPGHRGGSITPEEVAAPTPYRGGAMTLAEAAGLRDCEERLRRVRRQIAQADAEAAELLRQLALRHRQERNRIARQRRRHRAPRVRRSCGRARERRPRSSPVRSSAASGDSGSDGPGDAGHHHRVAGRFGGASC